MRIYDEEFQNPFFCMQVVINKSGQEENAQLFCSHTLKVCLVQEGSGVWEIEGKQYPIAKGDIFLLSNNENRKVVKVEPPQDMQFLLLEFEPKFIWSDNEDLLESGYLSIFFDRKTVSNRIEYHHTIAKEIGRLILDIKRELKQKNPEYKRMVKVNVLHVLVLIKRHFAEKISLKQDTISTENKAFLEKAIAYIHQNYQQDISLKSITQIALMSQSKFSRMFQKYNGIGFSQYVMRIRIQHAVDLLVNTDMTVLDIALECGFHNATNFYKAFRKVTDKTPKDFR